MQYLPQMAKVRGIFILYSLSAKTSYREIWRSLEVARLDVTLSDAIPTTDGQGEGNIYTIFTKR